MSINVFYKIENNNYDLYKAQKEIKESYLTTKEVKKLFNEFDIALIVFLINLCDNIEYNLPNINKSLTIDDFINQYKEHKNIYDNIEKFKEILKTSNIILNEIELVSIILNSDNCYKFLFCFGDSLFYRSEVVEGLLVNLYKTKSYNNFYLFLQHCKDAIKWSNLNLVESRHKSGLFSILTLFENDDIVFFNKVYEEIFFNKQDGTSYLINEQHEIFWRMICKYDSVEIAKSLLVKYYKVNVKSFSFSTRTMSNKYLHIKAITILSFASTNFSYYISTHLFRIFPNLTEALEINGKSIPLKSGISYQYLKELKDEKKEDEEEERACIYLDLLSDNYISIDPEIDINNTPQHYCFYRNDLEIYKNQSKSLLYQILELNKDKFDILLTAFISNITFNGERIVDISHLISTQQYIHLIQSKPLNLIPLFNYEYISLPSFLENNMNFIYITFNSMQVFKEYARTYDYLIDSPVLLGILMVFNENYPNVFDKLKFDLLVDHYSSKGLLPYVDIMGFTEIMFGKDSYYFQYFDSRKQEKKKEREQKEKEKLQKEKDVETKTLEFLKELENDEKIKKQKEKDKKQKLKKQQQQQQKQNGNKNNQQQQQQQNNEKERLDNNKKQQQQKQISNKNKQQQVQQKQDQQQQQQQQPQQQPQQQEQTDNKNNQQQKETTEKYQNELKLNHHQIEEIHEKSPSPSLQQQQQNDSNDVKLIQESMSNIQINENKKQVKKNQKAELIDKLDKDYFEIGKFQFIRNQSNLLGRGSNGTLVYKGLWSGRVPVAIKIMHKEFNPNINKEVDALIELTSKNCLHIVKYIDKEEDSIFVYLGLTLCDGSLQQLADDAKLQLFLENGENYESSSSSSPTTATAAAALISMTEPESRILNLLKDIIVGVEFLHSNGMVHNDLNPRNILVRNGRFIISDLGLSKMEVESSFSYTMHAPTGQGGYHPIEVLQEGKRKTKAVDIFSLGCIFYFLLSNGNHPFGNDKIYRMVNILTDKIMMDQSLLSSNPLAYHLIRSMISKDESSRPRIQNVSNHPLFWNFTKKFKFIEAALHLIKQPSNNNDNSKLSILLNQDTNSSSSSSTPFLTKPWNQLIDLAELSTPISNKNQSSVVYQFDQVKDLIRFIRNTITHYVAIKRIITTQFNASTLSNYKELLQVLSDQTTVLSYFESKLPNLIHHLYEKLKSYSKDYDYLNIFY